MRTHHTALAVAPVLADFLWALGAKGAAERRFRGQTVDSPEPQPEPENTRVPLQEAVLADDPNDPIIQSMIKNGIPLTQRNYDTVWRGVRKEHKRVTSAGYLAAEEKRARKNAKRLASLKRAVES